MSARDEQHRDVRWATKLLVGGCLVVANVVGAAVVLILAGWVLPTRTLVADDRAALGRNLVVFIIYLTAAVPLSALWGRAWVRVPRPPLPDAGEPELARHRRRARSTVLQAPVRLAVVQAVPWTVAVVLFAGLNLAYSLLLAFAVVCVVALGGLSTVAVAYRLSELALRREVGRVLAKDPPTGLRLAGVATRSVGGWVTGTAVPVLGLVLVAGTALVVPERFSVARLATVVMVLALVALAVGFLLTVLTALSIARPILAVRRALRRVEGGDLDTQVAIDDATELGLLQAGFNTMVGGLRERDRVRTLFGRQVGEDVAREALRGEVALGGEIREVAVLFVDLVGSTRMALEREPHEVVAGLNRFFSEVVGTVEVHRGWVNKFQGDAALAVFGAPTAIADPAGCALAAARDLAARLGCVDDVTAKIGVSAGRAVAGNIGDARRYEYTVIGDPVNEAARLCDLAASLDGRTAASGTAVDQAGDAEAARWSVVQTTFLRGRDAATRVATPRVDAAVSVTP